MFACLEFGQAEGNIMASSLDKAPLASTPGGQSTEGKE